MDCKHINEHLIDFLYQELEPDQLELIEGHLESCDGCTAELAAFESTRSAMRKLPELEPPPGLSQALMREAARAVPPAAAPGFWERLRAGMRMMVLHPAMTAAAMLVLVLGVSFMVYRGDGPKSLTPHADDLPPVPSPATAIGRPTPESTVEELPGTQQLQVEGQPNNNELGRLAKKFDQPGPAAAKDKTGASSGLATATPAARRGRRARPRLAAAVRPAPRSRSKLADRNKRSKAKPPARRATTSFDDEAKGGSKLGGLDGTIKARRPRPDKAAQPAAAKASLLAAKGDEALGAGKCDLALRYYDQALRADRSLAKRLEAMVQQCTKRVGSKQLARAQKRYPMLAGWIRTEAGRRSRKRQADQRKAAPPTGKRRAAEQREAPAAAPTKPPK